MRKCPRCGREYWDYPAISRRDNITKICPACGMLEALEALEDWKNAKKDNDKEV